MLQACFRLLGGFFPCFSIPLSGLLPGAASRSARVQSIDPGSVGQVTRIRWLLAVLRMRLVPDFYWTAAALYIH